MSEALVGVPIQFYPRRQAASMMHISTKKSRLDFQTALWDSGATWITRMQHVWRACLRSRDHAWTALLPFRAAPIRLKPAGSSASCFLRYASAR